jgi:serine/threonine-protein kinase
MAIAAGSSFGRYQIQSLLGAGGMGEVYRAQDTKLRRDVAIKFLPIQFTTDQERLRRFENEACAASSLNHPNILTIHEIGSEDGLHFITMEFIDGVTLRQQTAQKKLSLREVLDVSIQVASALTAAHAAGIIHRDIKPENIMVRPDGYVKVLDFGLAKLTEQQTHRSDPEAATIVKTEPGIIMGTASYMSPEQARGLEIDARTDIWSLGVVIYEMITERKPFEGQTSSDVISMILQSEPLAMREHAVDIPAELERIVRKTLAKDSEERYQTIKDMALDLKGLKRELEIGAELQRSVSREVKSDPGPSGAYAAHANLLKPAAVSTSTTGSLVDEPTRYKRHIAIAGIVLIAVAAVAYFGYFARDRNKLSTSKPAIASIAVLPFVNASNNPDAEYLSEGISESLINSLSQLPQLKVIARSSSSRFKGKESNLQEVASALGVEAIVTGRVIQLGDQLQIRTEMVDTRDQTQLWGGQYTRKVSDLLALQSEISREVADRLRLKLTNIEQQQLAKRSTTNPQAYELLLKARFYLRQAGSREMSLKAVEYYNKAIDADRMYALAYAELSTAYRVLSSTGVVDPKETTPKAQAAADRALELDQNLPEAHLALAVLQKDAWNWAAAEAGFKRSIELNPNEPRAHTNYAILLTVLGKHQEANAEAKLARELDPFFTGSNWRLGWQLYLARQYDKAIEQFKKTLELDPNHVISHVHLGHIYTAKEQYREAIVEYKEAIKLGDDTSSNQIHLGYALAMASARNEALTILKELQATKKYVSPAELAILHVGLGEKEQALAALERGFVERDLQMQHLNVEPRYDSLRSDTRFQDLVRRVGLPQ